MILLLALERSYSTKWIFFWVRLDESNRVPTALDEKWEPVWETQTWWLIERHESLNVELGLALLYHRIIWQRGVRLFVVLLTCVMMITGLRLAFWETDLILTELLSDPSKQVIPESMKSATYYNIPFHLSKEQSAPFLFNSCWLMTSRMVRVWLGGYRLLATTILLLPYWREVHSLRVQRLAQCRACLFWGKCICLFWNNYYLLYCPVQSYILSFISTFTCLIDRLHAHLLWDLQARRSLSRAMAASCQARPSVRIVDGRGKLKQTTRPQAFLGRRSHLLIWLCAVHVKIHLVWLNPPPNTLAESDQMASVNLSPQLLGMEFLIPHDFASRSFSGCITCFKRWVYWMMYPAELDNPFSPIPDEWQWT